MTRDNLPAVPLVGRDAEVQTLVSSLESVRSSRARAQTILVAGDIGVGKTRLARLAADEARQRGFAVAEGRAFAVESGLPYAIFADALVPFLRRLEAPVLTLLTRGAGSDMAGILPALFAPSKHADDESAADSKARMFWSFTELLERLSLRKPLLLLLDNLQWADPASLELLHFVARQTHSAAHAGSLVIVATHAGTEGDRHAGVRAMEQSLLSLGAARVVRLSPLSAEQTVELVHQTFDVAPGAVREFATTLYDWTRGNPFFIEETLKSLVDSGQLHRRNGAWTGWDVGALTPSRTARDVVLDRAGRLSAAARGLLEVAAVLGARVTLPVLRATSELPDDSLAEALDELRRTSFLVEEGGPLAYDFAHPLVRDAVYGALGPVRAQAMHDRIAIALEKLYGGDAAAHAAELAHHFTCGSMEMTGGRAVEYLAQAGRKALARHADRAAVEYLEAAVTHAAAAVTATPDNADSDLIETLARARQRVGDFDGAAALWQRVREWAQRNGDSSRVAVSERRMGLMALAAGDPRSALVHFDAGLAALQPPNAAPELTARLLLARSNALQAVGRRNDALADAAAALDAATRIGNGGLLARAHRAMLLLYVWTGPSSEARAHGERAVALAAASGERTIEWSAHWAMAIHGGL
ncbi:MAG TPA: BREX system ATP-binding domain-containing protein, partial [Gemmatimonadaceae bacterium]